MAEVTEVQVLEALKHVKDHDLGKDLVSLKMIKEVQICGGAVAFTLELTTPAHPNKEKFIEDCKLAVGAMPGVEAVNVRLSSHVRGRPAGAGKMDIHGVKNIVAVASGKGGVGKSTVSVNIALALAAEGAKIGILDADIYGPSQPQMLGVAGMQPEATPDHRIIPLESHGVKVMSMGFLVDEDSPVIWRGPMVMKALVQFLGETIWGELDYLILDLPPGTGDAQLTIVQQVSLAGAVIVTTPQDIALLDARKGLQMFRKTDVPILGILENMSYYECPQCGHRENIFDTGGGERAADRYEVPFLGAIPLDIKIRLGGDKGVPVVVGDPESLVAKAFREAARNVARQVAIANASLPVSVPELKIIG
ncbi:MAG: iron-sulfur cluster carrier protein ApbC [bacterium]|nr:iron-sulfur cluster carrier protein ApbC [bacterium]